MKKSLLNTFALFVVAVASLSAQANMVFVEGETFQMGSTDGGDKDAPVHTVTVSDFYIGKYKLTLEEYRTLTGKWPFNGL